MDAVRKTLVEGEDLTVPATLRHAMGVKPGDTVVFEMHGEEVRIRPEMQSSKMSASQLSALRRLQERLAPYRPKPGEPLVSEELIADRRAEAARE